MIASFALPWSGYQEKIELLNWNLLVKVKRNPLVINEQVLPGEVLIKEQGEKLWVKSLA